MNIFKFIRNKSNNKELPINVRKYQNDILLKNSINCNKVRFVNQPCFIYDIENNIINPKRDILIPVKSNGLFDSEKEPINLVKTSNNRMVCVMTYDKSILEFKNKINNSISGYVFYVSFNNEYSLDSNIIRCLNLDEISN